MDLEMAYRKRDRRLRRSLLTVLQLALASPRGGLNGRTLADQVDGMTPEGQRFEDDEHALQLCREMTGKGLLAEESLPRRRNQRFGIDLAFFRITSKGSSLLNETLAPDPDVEDERATEN